MSYDPITGKFFRHDLNREIGGLSSDGYIEMRIKNQHFYGHRLAWFLMTGNWINEVDHKDNNRSNNIWTNLRAATTNLNRKNTLLKSTNKSGYKGVSFCKMTKKWVATITANKQKTVIGYFVDPYDAALAYDIKAISLHGNFAKTNKMLGLI